MSHKSYQQLRQVISQYLLPEENLVSIGLFKRVPPTGILFLTRGIAWFLAQDFFVGVTDQRLVILPVSKGKQKTKWFEDVIYANFDEVDFSEDIFRNSFLKVQKIFKGEPLKLRFKSRHRYTDQDQFDFIGITRQGKKYHTEDVTT